MAYSIDSDIPLPIDLRISRISAEREAVLRLEVGQSFVAPKGRTGAARQAASDESTGGKKYTARKQADGTIRVWRLT